MLGAASPRMKSSSCCKSPGQHSAVKKRRTNHQQWFASFWSCHQNETAEWNISSNLLWIYPIRSFLGVFPFIGSSLFPAVSLAVHHPAVVAMDCQSLPMEHGCTWWMTMAAFRMSVGFNLFKEHQSMTWRLEISSRQSLTLDWFRFIWGILKMGVPAKCMIYCNQNRYWMIWGYPYVEKRPY